MTHDFKHEMHSWDRERKARRFFVGLGTAAVTLGIAAYVLATRWCWR